MHIRALLLAVSLSKDLRKAGTGLRALALTGPQLRFAAPASTTTDVMLVRQRVPTVMIFRAAGVRINDSKGARQAWHLEENNAAGSSIALLLADW